MCSAADPNRDLIERELHDPCGSFRARIFPFVFASGREDDADLSRSNALSHAALPPLGALIDEIERPGKGLIMLMGKGGVGKTTIATAIAAELAARGHDVLLTTTDPAAHLIENS